MPGLADPAELVAGGAKPARWSPFGAYLPREIRPRCAAVAAGPGVRSRTRPASSLRSRWPGRSRPGAGRTPAGGRWLDLCAGPGGKARLLAGLAAGRGARLLAADVRPHRAQLLRPAAPGRVPAGRLVPRSAGAAAAAVVAADGTAPAWRPGAFDRVLADVPCSGLGALRRRPEARWRRSPEDVAALGPLQRALLAAALDSAAPGGVVAYVTCSPHLAETRDVVTDVLAGRDDVQVLDAPGVLARGARPALPGAVRRVRAVLAAPARHRRDLPRAAAAARLTRGRTPAD